MKKKREIRKTNQEHNIPRGITLEPCDDLEYYNQLRDDYLLKCQKQDAIKKTIFGTLKYIFFTPISIALNIMSVIFRACGAVLSLGLPYGIYCVYKIIQQMSSGVSFSDISQRPWAFVFFILPFIAFAFSALCAALSDWMD